MKSIIISLPIVITVEGITIDPRDEVTAALPAI